MNSFLTSCPTEDIKPRAHYKTEDRIKACQPSCGTSSCRFNCTGDELESCREQYKVGKSEHLVIQNSLLLGAELYDQSYHDKENPILTAFFKQTFIRDGFFN